LRTWDVAFGSVAASEIARAVLHQPALLLSWLDLHKSHGGAAILFVRRWIAELTDFFDVAWWPSDLNGACGCEVKNDSECHETKSNSCNWQDNLDSRVRKSAIQGNLAEIKVGQLAQQKGQSQEVRDFGIKLQQDHGEANQKAIQAAKDIGIISPSEPNNQQKSVYDKLSKLSGAAFDREFAKHMVEDHRKDIAEYENEAKMNDAVGAYAKETLPHLQTHLKLGVSRIKATNATVGCGKRK
jgi:putative membrane protein